MHIYTDDLINSKENDSTSLFSSDHIIFYKLPVIINTSSDIKFSLILEKEKLP
jgi:hypothetical protein